MDDTMDSLAMSQESIHCLRQMRRTGLRYPRWWAVGAAYEELARRLVESLDMGSPSGLRIRRVKAIIRSYAVTADRLHEALIFIGVRHSHYKHIRSRLENKIAQVCSVEAQSAVNEAMNQARKGDDACMATAGRRAP
jgi:hypothetical protein